MGSFRSWTPFWRSFGKLARNIDLAQRRLLLPEWLRRHSCKGPITFEDGAPLNETSGDENPPLLPAD